MKKLQASLLKEMLVLLNDKVGLIFMFFMPILLVFLITIIQNSAYEIINENKITMLISDQDEGDLGDSLIVLLQQSKMFDLQYEDIETETSLSKAMLDGKHLTGLYIPKDFSKYKKEIEIMKVVKLDVKKASKLIITMAYTDAPAAASAAKALVNNLDLEIYNTEGKKLLSKNDSVNNLEINYGLTAATNADINSTDFSPG